jgi:glycosyltransferase involved in cell wall biosynthesis
LKVLHVYTGHRGRGGAENAIESTIDICRRNGLEIEVFARLSTDLRQGILGRLEAGFRAIHGGTLDSFSTVLNSFRPNVVHVHDLFPLISPWIVRLSRERGIPVVFSVVHYRLTCPIATHFRDGGICTECLRGREYQAVFHNCRNNIAESLTVAAYNAIESRLGPIRKHVSCFLCPSEFARQWLIDHGGIERSRTRIVTPLVQVPEDAADAGAGAYIAFGGRFVAEKGLDVIFEASRLTGIPFRVSRNASYPANVPIPPNIGLDVTQNKEELWNFYRGARALVFPSIWYETFGLAGAEGMGHGIPLIASRIGALPELIEDGVDGLLTNPGDARDLADKVMRLWNAPELSRRFGRLARKKALTWGPQQHFEQLNAVYASLCGGGVTSETGANSKWI